MHWEGDYDMKDKKVGFISPACPDMPSIPFLVSDCLWMKATSFHAATFGFAIIYKEVGLIVRKKGMGGCSDASFLCL